MLWAQELKYMNSWPVFAPFFTPKMEKNFVLWNVLSSSPHHPLCDIQQLIQDHFHIDTPLLSSFVFWLKPIYSPPTIPHRPIFGFSPLLHPSSIHPFTHILHLLSWRKTLWQVHTPTLQEVFLHSACLLKNKPSPFIVSYLLTSPRMKLKFY